MCQETSQQMEGSGGPRSAKESSWSKTLFTLRDIASKYNDTNLPKYLFVQKDYNDQAMGLQMVTGDLLEVFGFHSLSCVKGEYDAGQHGICSVSVPLSYAGKVRKLPKCEYQFPLAMDLVRHFPKFVRVTFAPRSRGGPLGLGEVLELIKADEEVLHVKKNGENLGIPLSCRGDFEEILFKDTKDYDLRSLVNSHLCPMWVELTEMKRIREGFTSFKHFSGQIKLNYVMEEKLLLCRVVKDDGQPKVEDGKVDIMCIPVESVCRNGTSPTFKLPTGILKDSLHLYSAVPDWDLSHLHTIVNALNFVTNQKATLHPRKCNPIVITEAEEDVYNSVNTSSTMSDSSPPVVAEAFPVPPPRRKKKQLKANFSMDDWSLDNMDSTSCSGASTLPNLDRPSSGSTDNNTVDYWKNKFNTAMMELVRSRGSTEDVCDEQNTSKRSQGSKISVENQSSIPDSPPPTPPRKDFDVRPPPPPIPCRPFYPKPSKLQTGPPLPPQSSKPTYITPKSRPALPPEPPSTPRPSKPSINDQVPPPAHESSACYLTMSGIAGNREEDPPRSYFNGSFGHPRPPSPNYGDGNHGKKSFSGPLSELDRKTWEREVPLEDEQEDLYTVALGPSDYDPPINIDEDNYLCMEFQDRVPSQLHGQSVPSHGRHQTLPPRNDRYSASSTSSSTTWSSGYNSDTTDGAMNSDILNLSVGALAERLTFWKLEKLADACRDNCIDGALFSALTAEDLRGEPFNLSGFYLKKALMVKDEGWSPKMK